MDGSNVENYFVDGRNVFFFNVEVVLLTVQIEGS